MVCKLSTMGCIQSKFVARSALSTNIRKPGTSNGIQTRQKPYDSKTDVIPIEQQKQQPIDLDMHSPRTEATNSAVLRNGNPGTSGIQFAEDLEPVSSLPDSMTVYSMYDKPTSTLTASNVSIRQRESVYSRGTQLSRGTGDLSIEDLDPDMDDFGRVRPRDKRYIHHPGERINPSTTDILLPRRKETPRPAESQSTGNKSGKKQTKKQGSNPASKLAVSNEVTELSDVFGNTDVPASPSKSRKSKKERKNRLNQRKKKSTFIQASQLEDNTDTFSPIEGTIRIDSVERLNELFDDNDQLPNENDNNKENDNDKVNKNIKKHGSAKEKSQETIKFDDITTPDIENTPVFKFTPEPEPIKSTVAENQVTKATREVVKDYLKDTDVAKVDVNTIFQQNIEKEKVRMARKRKRTPGRVVKTTDGNKDKDTMKEPPKPSDHEIEKFFTATGDKTHTQETTSLQIRPGSKTSFVSIASMNPIDSEYIFDDTADTGELISENTLDDFGSVTKLEDLEAEEEFEVNEAMDNKSVFSTSSVKSSDCIKPYKQNKTNPGGINTDFSLGGIGFEAQNVPQSGSSRGNNKTKQKLLFSRHARRPVSETVLRIAGKPPLPPSQQTLTRPHSDSAPRGKQPYSRYMAVDTDLF